MTSARILAFSVLILGMASFAQAQATRTWVSGVGDDVNPCSRTAPCKTFAGAISKTAAGGEIDALDSGGFGAVTITKGITIDGRGALASILASGTNGIVINAPATDDVIIRGLSINGAPLATSLTGIRVLAARSVAVEQTKILNFGNRGISVETSANCLVTLDDVTIRNIGNYGIAINPTAGVVRAAFSNTRVQNVTNAAGTGDAVFIGGASTVANLTGCLITGSPSSLFGLHAGGGTTANLDGVLISGNGGGVSSTESAGIRLAKTMIVNNTGAGVSGAVVSFGNNRIQGNGSSNGPVTNIGQQ